MAQNQNTFEKRKREMDKKMKADAKRARKSQRKNGGESSGPPSPFGYEFKTRSTSD